MNWEAARKIADAVLYEGYVLYPYRASAVKNQFRWQFGIVAPHGYVDAGGSEPWEMQAECLIEASTAPRVHVRIRFLELQERRLECGQSWEDGQEREFDLPLLDLACGTRVETIQTPAVSARMMLAAERVETFWKLRVRIENWTPWSGGDDRNQALRHSLVSAHTLLAVEGGAFISLIDPPPEAAAAAKSCRNLHTWPVLVGTPGARDMMLSSPIILYDYPEIAAESPGDLCDATEIDELLTLRVMTLTEDEKREARATSDRARSIVERSDQMPPEVFERLHGAIRYMQPSVGQPADWQSFLNPPGETAPEEASLQVGETIVAKGSRVRLRPSRRADSMDLFLAGRVARVHGVYRDLDNQTYVAVAMDDDPAADLSGIGRFFYFYPDEIEPLEGKEQLTV